MSTENETVPETVEPTVNETVEPAPDADIEGLDPSIDDLAALLPTNISPEKPKDDDDEVPAEEPAADDEPAAGDEAGEDGAEPADDAAAAPEPEAEPESPAAPETKAAEQPKADPNAEARQQRDVRLREINGKLAAILKLPEGERDAFELSSLLAEKDVIRDAEMDELRQDAARQKADRDYENFWTATFAKDHPDIGAKTGRETWEKIVEQVGKDYPTADAAVQQGIASDRFKQRVNVIKGQRAAANKDKPKVGAKPAPAAKPKPAGTGRVVPAGVGSARPPSAAKTAEDEIDALLTKELSNFLPR